MRDKITILTNGKDRNLDFASVKLHQTIPFTKKIPNKLLTILPCKKHHPMFCILQTWMMLYYAPSAGAFRKKPARLRAFLAPAGATFRDYSEARCF